MPAQFPIIFGIAAIVLIAIIALAKSSKKDKKARSIATPTSMSTAALTVLIGALLMPMAQESD